MKFSSKENRLVFDGFFSRLLDAAKGSVDSVKQAFTKGGETQPNAPTEQGQAPQAAPEGQPKPSEAPKASEVAEAKKETGAALAGVQTEVQLSELKGTVEELKAKMQKDFEELGNVLNLNGQEVSGVISGDLDFNSIKQSLTDAVLKLLAGKDLTKFVDKLNAATGLNVKKEEVDDAIALIYANSIVAVAEGKFGKDFVRYKDFVDSQKKQTPPKTYEIPFKVKITGITGFVPEFDAKTSGFAADHEAYDKANPAQKPKEEQEPTTEEVELAKKTEKVKALRNSFAGTALSWLGIIKVGEGPEDEKEARINAAYEAALSGSNPIARWVVWLLGGAGLLDGGGTDIEAAVNDMGEKGGFIKAIHEKGKASFISLEGTAKKYGGDVQAESGAKELDNTGFAGVLADPKKVPEHGLKLKTAFSFDAGKKLRINLKNGGEMVIPKGSFVRKFDGTQEGDDKADKVLKDADFAIIGQLPAGTAFNGKVALTLEDLSATV